MDTGAYVNVKCTRQQGAALLIKDRAYRTDAISRHAFEKCFIKNHTQWLSFANDELARGITLNDIVFVTGCDLTKEWTIATFNEATYDVEASFSVNVPPGAAGAGVWGEWQSEAHVPNRSGPGPLLPPPLPTSNSVTSGESDRNTFQANFNQCIFLRGYRIFRRIIPFTLRLKALQSPRN